MGCVKQAKKFGIGHVWIDTCCINKSSSSELSEAINSISAWVRMQIFGAWIGLTCDIDPDSKKILLCTGTGGFYDGLNADFRNHELVYDNKGYGKATLRWFNRGWTLQKLIAPKEVFFFFFFFFKATGHQPALVPVSSEF